MSHNCWKEFDLSVQDKSKSLLYAYHTEFTLSYTTKTQAMPQFLLSGDSRLEARCGDVLGSVCIMDKISNLPVPPRIPTSCSTILSRMEALAYVLAVSGHG